MTPMSESSHNPLDYAGRLTPRPLPHPLVSLRNVAGLVGVIGMALLALTLAIKGERAQAFRGLLFGFHFWIGPTLGAMAFVMISHMTGGGWGVVYRRFGEAAFTGGLPWMLVVCMFLVPGYAYLFPWAHLADFKGETEAFHVMARRLPWYSPMWFFFRQLAYFAIWGILAYQLRTGSLRLDHKADPVLRRRLRKWSAAGIVLFFVTVTSYAMDYIMSRETVWFSSILGFISAISFSDTGVALCTLTVCYFALRGERERNPISDVLSPQHLNDLGNLLLALTILWMYTSFAQFLIQWNGNMTSDIGYYVHRGLGQVPNGWRFVGLSLFLGHFLLPFFLLLMKGLKRKAATLARICVWILIMRIVESLWVIAPSTNSVARAGDPGSAAWTDIVAFLGVGGIWVFLYLRALASEPMLPLNATDQPEPINHAGTHATVVAH
jgi:hypothetical protein